MMSNQEKQVELLLAKDDQTWSTEYFNVPEEKLKKYLVGSPKWERAVIDWAQEQVMTQPQYRGVVHVGIYNYSTENMSDG
ncbi:MAG: hypothetical protein ACWGQW_05300 [bacterium]